MSSVEMRKENGNIVLNFIEKQHLWFLHYLDGYYKSTVFLLDNLNSQNTTLIYPTLFNFSQYLELWIKLLLLTINDSNNVKALNIDNHSIQSIIRSASSKYRHLLESYGVNADSLNEIANEYSYFVDFSCENQALSMAARFPLNNKNPNIIINFDKIDKVKKDNYNVLKNKISKILKSTFEIKEMFFEKYLNSILEDYYDQL